MNANITFPDNVTICLDKTKQLSPMTPESAMEAVKSRTLSVLSYFYRANDGFNSDEYAKDSSHSAYWRALREHPSFAATQHLQVKIPTDAKGFMSLGPLSEFVGKVSNYGARPAAVLFYAGTLLGAADGLDFMLLKHIAVNAPGGLVDEFLAIEPKIPLVPFLQYRCETTPTKTLEEFIVEYSKKSAAAARSAAFEKFAIGIFNAILLGVAIFAYRSCQSGH